MSKLKEVESRRKSSTRKSGVKSNASNKDMLEQERLVSEMAEKFSSDWFRNVQIGLDLPRNENRNCVHRVETFWGDFQNQFLTY